MENKTEEKEELDVFHYHELMDRVSVLIRAIEDNLMNHSVLKEEKHIAILLKVERAGDLLAEAYQEIGEHFFNLLDGDTTDGKETKD